jgi:hypothetical protein
MAATRELVAAAAALGAPPAMVGRDEVDQINIIARWISHHSDESERAFFNLPHDPETSPADAAPQRSEAVEAFAARVTTALMTIQPDANPTPESDTLDATDWDDEEMDQGKGE